MAGREFPRCRGHVCLKRVQRLLMSRKILQYFLPAVILLSALTAYLFFTGRAERNAEREIALSALETLDVQTEAILTLLEKHRYLPSIIARQREILDLMDARDDPVARNNAWQMMQKAAGGSGALEIAIVDPGGNIILTTGGFFTAGRVGDGELLLAPAQGRLGRASLSGPINRAGIRAYAFSSAIGQGDLFRGIVVVVASIEAMERSWALSGKPVFATNERGQMVAKDFQAEDILGGNTVEFGVLDSLRKERQITAKGEVYRLFDRPIAITGWRLNVLEKMQPVRDAGGLAGTIALLASALAGLLAMLFVARARQRMIRDRQERANALRLERKVAERTRELVNANKKLESEIAVRRQAEAALVKAQKELVQAGKLAGLGQMSAALSHEFNQPLAAIRSYAENASQYLEKNRTEEVGANIRHIVELTDRMASISKHLRNFARRPREKIGAVNLHAVVADAREIIATKLNASRAVLDVQLPGTIPEVMGGHNRLQQVLVNLFSNSIDAKKPGRKPILTLTGTVNDGRVILVLEDNGSGFEAGVIDQIFDPFFTTKDVNKGLGLGLSISYNIIKDFGGSISATNKPEGGARFVIELVPAAVTKMKAAQ